MVIRRIEPISLAKVTAVLYGFFGLLFALPMACFSSMMGSMMDSMDSSGYGDAGSAAFTGFGIASIIVFPIMFAIGGFIGGLLYAFLYNLVAGWVGGIEVDVDGLDTGNIL
ncbi:MAG TPA: hypothetical protein VD962_01950 [Rubricoccaceae bacterium]|nr:hypothetical protein [Rubricoccaceae bacterium]